MESQVTPSPLLRPSRRVLVIDDDRDLADSVAEILFAMGHEAKAVYDGITAIGLTESYRPDVVMLDLGMAGMDGFEIASRLRAQPFMAGVPIVALTGHDQPRDRARTQAAGFDAHLAKPATVARLEQFLDAVAR